MNLTFTIARRYLLSKKSTNAINIITWISVIGMSIGTAALILILSVFNGFEGLLSGMLNSFNPDLKVTLIEGKYISKDSIDNDAILQIKGVDKISYTLEETSFFSYKGSQEVGIIKGVDKNFEYVTRIDSMLLMGQFKLEDEQINYCVLGSGINTKLSVNPSDPLTPVTAYMYSRFPKGPLGKDFKTMSVYPSGVFSVGSDVDMAYILVSFDAVNHLLDMEDHFSAIELRLSSPSDEKFVTKELIKILGDKFEIRNRYQQDEGFLKIMNIEKWVSYLIACLTLLIIAFNLVGSLWMIVLEKKKDISILKSMGYTTKGINSIFLLVGMLISGIGLFIGFLLAIMLYLLQKYYGLISIPEGFLIDAYPVELKYSDFLIVTVTVLAIGYIASILPSVRAGKISAFVRQE
ncbi:MAG: ABC transporter permease [Saprospiraceae bacterium]|nr:ABC transporter permease [Saprospiraceae bacterium]